MGYLLACFNIFVILVIGSAAYPVLGMILTIISLVITFLLPNSTVGHFLISFTFGRRNIQLSELTKEEKSLYLSICMYMIVFYIAGVIGAAVTFGAIGIVALAIWLATGWWWDGGIVDFLNAVTIAKLAVKIFQAITSVGEVILNGIVSIEMQVIGIK